MAIAIQGWVGVIGALLTAVVGLTKYFNYRSRRDRQTDVGSSFANTVDSLAAENETKRMAAAVLLRRFFDDRAEQGGSARPYAKEAIEVIAGLLREDQPRNLQKVLADGLRYARDLSGADLQRCDLRNSYLGVKDADRIILNLSRADLFEAQCDESSFKGVTAVEAVFYGARLRKAVFTGANLSRTDFRDTELAGAKFNGAAIGGAKFSGAKNIPLSVQKVLKDDGTAPAGVVIPDPEGST